MDVGLRKTSLFGYGFGGVSPLLQLPYACEKFQRAALSASYVFRQAHNERILVTNMDHHRRYGCLTE
ncbi:hypothetical protein CBM2586_A10301 [Cupriavidus phytorum]|uniref:Uncharacterized protein n=1 Tax=Cupriavidus taiwanensis TaxID=164546 RepID=A0A375B9I8_9BURK|nr:hypothetical protein CBM2586_A10301 [Cupriavidus taiwanensis]